MFTEIAFPVQVIGFGKTLTKGCQNTGNGRENGIQKSSLLVYGLALMHNFNILISCYAFHYMLDKKNKQLIQKRRTQKVR